jgi:hypothetical protein
MHDITVSGVDIPNGADAADIELLNDSGPVGGAASPLGGTIHGDATLQVNTANLTLSAGSLDLLIINANRALTGGTIDGNATVDVSAPLPSLKVLMSKFKPTGRRHGVEWWFNCRQCS